MRFFVLLSALLLLGTGLTACIDPVSPDLARSDRLVVDGLVTDGPGPHTIELRRAAAYEQSLDAIEYGITDAQVTIRDDTGREVRLGTTTKPGRYRTKEGELVGVPGRSYTLDIQLPDGRHFRSEPERMPPGPPIDTVTAQPERGGLEVTARVRDPEEEKNFYRWKTTGVFGRYGVALYVDQRQTNRFDAVSDRLFNGNVYAPVLRYLPPESFYLYGRYSVVVDQYTLTPEAKRFWSTLHAQVRNEGNTFSSPPSVIRGNIVNVNDPSDYALGYFGASEVTRTQACIDPQTYPTVRATVFEPYIPPGVQFYGRTVNIPYACSAPPQPGEPPEEPPIL